MHTAMLLDNLKRAFDAAMRLGKDLAYFTTLAIRESVGRLLGSLDMAEQFLTGTY